MEINNSEEALIQLIETTEKTDRLEEALKAKKKNKSKTEKKNETNEEGVLTDCFLLNDKMQQLEKSQNFKVYQKRENLRIISKLQRVCIFSSIFMTIELIGGYIAGSLAIMTDAAHLLSDLSGFFISMISLYIALRPANNKLTYGYHRSEIIGSMVSISIIWLLTAWLIIEAFIRLFNPEPINALLMLGIASLGLIFNLIMAKILMSDEEIVNKFEDDPAKVSATVNLNIANTNNSNNTTITENNSGESREDNSRVRVKQTEGDNQFNQGEYDLLLRGGNELTNNSNRNDNNNNNISNISNNNTNELRVPNMVDNNNENPILRSTFIHILGDIIQSIGVVVASSLIYFLQDSHPMIVKVDPICTFIFGIIVLSTSIPVAKDCINVLMEAAPASIHQEELIDEFKEIPDIVDFHDIHVWCLSVGKTALTAHFISKNPQKTLEEATEICKRYGIFHSTIQVEDYTQRRRGSFKICTHINDNQIH